MNIEIVAIGNEILTGATVNTNAAEIGQALFKAGYRVQRHTSIPDNPVMLRRGLIEAIERGGLVIATGGLGPTCDDVTRQAAAEIFNSDFYYDEAIADELKVRYGDLSIGLKDQATVPSKAIVLKNPVGTASGLVFSSSTATLILMPGVPREMRVMLEEQVLPYLKSHFLKDHRYVSRAVHFFKLNETSVDPLLRELQVRFPSVEFGIYPSHGILSVYATVHTSDEAEGMHVLAPALEEIASRFRGHLFEAHSGKIEEAIRHMFVQNRWTLSVAESCTGGQVSARLTQVPGASEYFLGGIVSYSNSLKQSLLGVPEKLIRDKGAVSEEVVMAMAKGAIGATGSDFSIAISGVAGPSGGTPEKPIGTVWMAVVKKGMHPYAVKFQAKGTRDIIIEWSANTLFGELITYCRKIDKHTDEVI